MSEGATHRRSWLDGWEAARSGAVANVRGEAEEAWRLAFQDSPGAALAAREEPRGPGVALEAENDNERFIQATLRERGLCGVLFFNGRERVACIKGVAEAHTHAREDTERPDDEDGPMDEACTCRHPPEGMIGWDRGMIDRDCPLHGHEALPERRDPQMEKVVEAMRATGEQEAWNDWYPRSPPSKRNAHRHGFNAGQAAGLIEGEAAAREDTERPDGDSHWATVVIDDAFEPREITEAEAEQLYESGIGIDVERMWIRPGVRDTEQEHE